VPASKGSALRKTLADVVKQRDGHMLHERVTLTDGRTLDVVAVPYRDVDGSACRLEMIRDMTAAQLANEAQRIAATTFETQQALLLLDPRAKIIRANVAFSALTGFEQSELIGEPIRMLHEPVWEQGDRRTAKLESQGTQSWQGELECRNSSGLTFPTWCTASVVLDERGETTHYVVSYTDISERKETEKKILNLAFYDTLTKLPNRRMLLDRLTQRLSANTRRGTFGALIFVDLDKFKELNDSKGHDAGDLLLQQVAMRLQGALRDSDTVARFGGDEFVILLDELSSHERIAGVAAETVAENLRRAINRPFGESVLKEAGGASFGITLFDGRDHTVESLLKQADLALYQAKQMGRNSIRFYSPEMQEVIDRKIELERSLRNALTQGQLVMLYQPQIDRSGRLVGAEALLRWQHPKHGLVPPSQFVHEAEESGMIVPIGLWALQTGCFQLASWQNYETTKHLTLSVNISPRQFRQKEFVDSVRRILEQTGADPRLLLDNLEGAVSHMHELREMGVRFAIDDFGTGYSSLSYLKRLPVDYLKIDQSFVQDVDSNPESAAIVRAIIAMGQTLNLHVTAEGVESARQAQFLEQEGCNSFQGFYFGQPVASTTALLSCIH
jgi:diguanylate cyclase (GGDEF)-like protein/PAS domain S-box-containing protein